VTLTLGALEEIERWVLSWGADVEVIEPVELRERLRRVGEALQRQYATESTPPPASA
jgi:proteasome accessory factor B